MIIQFLRSHIKAYIFISITVIAVNVITNLLKVYGVTSPYHSAELGLDDMIAFYFSALLFVPLIETLIFNLILQGILLAIFKRLNLDLRIVFPIVLVLFISWHFPIVDRMIVAIPMGIAFIYTFNYFSAQKKISFWMTVAVHSSLNMIAIATISIFDIYF